MKKIKLCCFTVNYTHACIIANNFINKKLENVKVIYINEKNEEKRLKNIISKFYKKMDDKLFYTQWLNEEITNNYTKEKFVFVVSGKESFVNKVNKYIDISNAKGYVINCYYIFDIQESVKEIIQRHDYYINTTGIVKKEFLNL